MRSSTSVVDGHPSPYLNEAVAANRERSGVEQAVVVD